MIKNLGVQIYTIRDYLDTEDNVKRSFEKLAKIGYSEIQTAGLYEFMKPKAFAEAARNNNIKIIGSHIPLEKIINDTDEVMNIHSIYETTNIGIGSMQGVPDICFGNYKIDDLYAFIDKFNTTAKKLYDNGFKLTYHHHSFEFQKINNQTIMDLLIDKFDKITTSFVVDTFWLQCGGVSILEYMDKMSGRIDILHLKDFIPNQRCSEIYTELFNGNINFKSVIDKGNDIGVKHYIVEQDTCPGDPFDSLKISYDNMKKAGLMK